MKIGLIMILINMIVALALIGIILSIKIETMTNAEAMKFLYKILKR